VNAFIRKHQKHWGDNPVSLLEEYEFQPLLTAELDLIQPSDLDLETVYKIVLWKLDRFPQITDEQVTRLKELSRLKPKEHKKAKNLLEDLLKTPGIALPMASTILRFVNPKVFQIIDDRAYRMAFPDATETYPSKPVKITAGYLAKSTRIYFEYLDELHRISSDKLPFQLADRILYQLDKKMGNKIGQKGGQQAGE
jgi:hypothetical protein